MLILQKYNSSRGVGLGMAGGWGRLHYCIQVGLVVGGGPWEGKQGRGSRAGYKSYCMQVDLVVGKGVRIHIVYCVLCACTHDVCLAGEGEMRSGRTGLTSYRKRKYCHQLW